MRFRAAVSRRSAPAGATSFIGFAPAVAAALPFVASTLPGGFEQFRVELGGLVVGDLVQCLNAEVTTGADGWTTVRCRLDPAVHLEGAVLYDPVPNLVVTQRPLARPGGGRWPFRVSFSH